MDFTVSKESTKLDVDMIHDYLCNRSYWAKGRTLEQVKRSIEHSICFGVYDSDSRQCAFARVVSDRTVYAYIMDVFVLEAYRGKGVGTLLIESILNDSALKETMRWHLDTLDAHPFYARFGFGEPKFPGRAMQKRKE